MCASVCQWCSRGHAPPHPRCFSRSSLPPQCACASHLLRDALALCDQLLRVVLRDDGLEDLVADGRQHTLVVVEAEVAENLV
eukprot:829612-Pleurochrysis_carterae.AAC.1